MGFIIQGAKCRECSRITSLITEEELATGICIRCLPPIIPICCPDATGGEMVKINNGWLCIYCDKVIL